MIHTFEQRNFLPRTSRSRAHPFMGREKGEVGGLERGRYRRASWSGKARVGPEEEGFTRAADSDPFHELAEVVGAQARAQDPISRRGSGA